MSAVAGGGDRSESWDTLNFTDPQELHWTTDNVGEAAPGVLTPLGFSLWKPVGDWMPRRLAYAMGAFSRSERTPPSEAERVVHAFYGRIAMKVEYIAAMGDRMPGTTGEDAVVGLFGKVPESISFNPTRRRYPVIAAKLPYVFARSPARVRKISSETDAWWREQVPRLGDLDQAAAAATFKEAHRRFDWTLLVHSTNLMASVTPLYEELTKLVARTGIGDVGLLSGTGGAEMAIIEDIWDAARGRIELDEVITNHGFHGPHEGEISSRVWREDPEPLRRLADEYAAREDSEDPSLREGETRRQADLMRAEILDAVPAHQRPGTRFLLKLAAKRIPMRGVGKRSFLQALDVARGSARRIGDHLAADGSIADPEDVFYLTAGELTGTLPANAAELVALRRERRAEYERFAIPGSWRGRPEPIEASGPDEAGAPGTVEGVGVSAGVVEGVVRVVTDPAFAEVEPDEVLVAPTTDPSWSSIMFVSSALVVDIGGPLSHAAVVARELGLPCVVNTGSGSKQLRTGDRVRVDGAKGTVEVLKRAAQVGA